MKSFGFALISQTEPIQKLIDPRRFQKSKSTLEHQARKDATLQQKTKKREVDNTKDATCPKIMVVLEHVLDLIGFCGLFVTFRELVLNLDPA